MPLPLNPEFQAYSADYPLILEGHTSLKTTCYSQAPCYLIPRLVSGHSKIEKHPNHYRLITSSSGNVNVASIGAMSPKEYLSVLVKVVQETGGITDVPHAYAMVLQKMGLKVTKRPWGNQDFVFETANLTALAGSRYSRIRTYISRLLRSGVMVRPVTSADTDAAVKLENLWASRYLGRFGKAGYLAGLLPHLEEIPPVMRVFGLGAFDGESLVGLVIGNQISKDSWACTFRYADNTYHGLSMLLFREISKHYSDLPFEVDGSSAGKDLHEFKRRLLTKESLNHQIFMYTVKLK